LKKYPIFKITKKILQIQDTMQPSRNQKVNNQDTNKPDNKQDSSLKNSTSKSYKVFLGGTPVDCSTNEVSEYFSRYGTVKKVEFPLDKRSKRQKGFGFITFQSEAVYQAVIQDREHLIRG
jgi:RNA-binding protein Musashi